MKHLFFLAGLAAVTTTAFAADVGVSVRIGEPGFYGRLDVGDFPPPRVVYRQPMVVQPVPMQAVREPIYLRVPPGHSKNWRKHCSKYDACGQPVYFVQDSWYNREYAPRYRERHGRGGRDGYSHDDRRDRHDGDRARGDDRGHGKDHRRD